MLAFGFGICKSGRKVFIFSLQIANNSYLCSNISVDKCFKRRTSFSRKTLVVSGSVCIEKLLFKVKLYFDKLALGK